MSKRYISKPSAYAHKFSRINNTTKVVNNLTTRRGGIKL